MYLPHVREIESSVRVEHQVVRSSQFPVSHPVIQRAHFSCLKVHSLDETTVIVASDADCRGTAVTDRPTGPAVITHIAPAIRADCRTIRATAEMSHDIPLSVRAYT